MKTPKPAPAILTPSISDSSTTIGDGKVHFISGEPALQVGDALVIAELHIAYEQKFFPHTDVFFTQKLIDRVAALVRETGARRLIINGDVKHSVDNATVEEQRELAKFFSALQTLGIRTTLVKGNHDGDIENFVHDVELVGAGGLLLGDIGLCHGNAWPSEEISQNARTLIVAHSHPCVELGGKRLQCWLVGGLNERAAERFAHWSEMKVIVMPAFSQLVGGTSVNKAASLKNHGKLAKPFLLGPLFKNEMFKIGEAEVYLLDGTCVGSLRTLSDLQSES